MSDVRVQFAFNSGLAASYILGSTVGSYLLDVIGRRLSLMIGIGQMSAFLFVQGALDLRYFTTDGAGNPTTPAGAGGVFVAMYFIQWFLWVSFFSPVVNIYPAELMTSSLRLRGYALTNVISMAAGFASQYSGLPMFEALHGWCWIIFAFTMLIAVIGIYIFYPETAGLTLEQIDILIQKNRRRIGIKPTGTLHGREAIDFLRQELREDET